MSSTSSLCSSDADILLDRNLPMMKTGVRMILERFSVCAHRLRAALDVEAMAEEGDSMCVSVHAALEQLNESMRELFRHQQFKTNTLILPSLQLVQAVKELKFDASANVDVSRPLLLLDSLEGALLNNLLQRQMSSALPRPLLSNPLPAREYDEAHRSSAMGGGSKLMGSGSRGVTGPGTNNSAAYSSPQSQADSVLIDRVDGVEIAFERAKTSSRYCKELANFVKSRLQVEAEHAKKVSTIVEQTRLSLQESFRSVPLRAVFESGFDCERDFASTVKETIDHLNDRFLKVLECRRNEHDSMRRSLKNEWTKQMKALADTEAEHRKAEQNLLARQETVRKLKREEKRKEVEKRRKSDEEAIVKMEEAKRSVVLLDADVNEKKIILRKTKPTTLPSDDAVVKPK